MPKASKRKKPIQRTDKCKECKGPFPPKRPNERLARYMTRDYCGSKCQIAVSKRHHSMRRAQR
jgi:hypothetical protein